MKHIFLFLLLVILCGFYLLVICFGVNGYAKQSFLANLSGQVLDKNSKKTVPNAHILITPLNLLLTTDNDGLFSVSDIDIPHPIYPITITISAEKYASWQLANVPLVSGDTLIITSQLSDTPYFNQVPSSVFPPSTPEHLSVEFYPDTISNPNIMPLLNFTPLPQYIRVRVSGFPYSPCKTDREYTVETVEFKDYLKHVLPNEWNYQWHPESLRAGALAVKMYAWYWIAYGGKWKDADVWDSVCDQVYNPNFAFASTNAAVDDTWNWALLRNNMLLHTSYRSTNDLCIAANLEGSCMGQLDSNVMAEDGFTWDEILLHFYNETTLKTIEFPHSGYALRFNGTKGDYNENRVLISLDGDPPVDVGSDDFTIEWWMKSLPEENNTPLVACGNNNHWIYGNIILDKSYSDGTKGFGVSLLGGHIAFGVQGNDSTAYTLCGKRDIRDGIWHHIAIQRRKADGFLWIYIDGKLEATGKGPDGDVSYPNDQAPLGENDPYISISAWKLDDDHDLHPFFRGWIDEIRFSNVLHYTSNFASPPQPFYPDEYTVGLYHFDEGVGNVITDTSDAIGGPSHGIRKYGGIINGPEWLTSDLFQSAFLPIISKSVFNR